ncbi:hypothetical protein B9Z19DRAFT_1030955 [Tuber borchii]|uniref:DH domain-containing protein n=1 Tax=Tuber borchii TaxID=42251 RepID=A0A2T6ZIX9_TUBBO|nr:hypothetical protein B9Z19DRAFT_1030955 [Tuber borchii]
MASLSSPPPHLAHCTPYCTSDPVLGHVLVFFNPHSSSSSTSVSRIEAHILTCAGLQSYPKLTLSPSSPLYAAVNHLPSPKQNHEVYRGLAIAVLKYFSELPKTVKETILQSKKNNVLPNGEAQAVAFDEMHAGDLAARLKELELESLLGDLNSALAERFLTWLDIDLVLRSPADVEPDAVPEEAEKLLALFGEPTHLPFTKLKRTQSRPASSRPRPPKDSTEGIGRELEQLRITESSYVGKLQDLLDNLVKPLRGRASQRKGDGGFPNGRDLEALFPPSLDRILELNTAFLQEIETGSLPEVADCCLRRFPDFKESYEEYIQASSEFPQLLAKFAKDRHSSFSKRVQQAGEQKLRSMIIEPVQRLPRYTLLIDSIINLLAFDDPSLPKLIDAREIITEICSLQSSDKDERSKTTKRLQSIVVSWPPSLRLPGRLITAFDFLDVLPPFNDRTSEAIPSTILLFPDRLLILRRPKHTSMQARAIMAEVDKPGGGGISNYGSGTKREGLGCDLQFAGWMDLADVKFAESDGGDVIWMTLARDLRDSWDVRAGGMGIRRLRLLNAYEGRATKLTEDIVKARLEGRILNGIKGLIGLRETKVEGLGLWACVWGSEDRYTTEGKKGSVLVYIDDGGGGLGSPGKTGRELAADVGKGGVDIAVNVEAIMGNKLRVEFRSWNEYSSTDTVSREEFLAVFTKRLSSIVRLHSLPQHPPLTAPLMSANRKLLRSLGVPFDGESRFSRLRPPSPVKLLSSVFGSSNSNAPGTPGSPSKSRQLMDRTQSQMLPPKMLDRSSAMLQKRSTVLGIMGDWNGEPDEGDLEISSQSITMPSESPLKRLEETLGGFVKVLKKLSSAEHSDLMPLRNMQGVDDAAVEGFLGMMLTDPKTARNEKGMGIDIVFDAFKRFLRREWKDGMGSVIDGKGLVELRSKSDTLYPGDFEDFFKIFVLDWAPQNKRAFKTLVLLLKNMQNKVENPDDKGLLTKAFTELLVEDEDPLEFMPLVDRLVEEADNLFSEPLVINNGEFSLPNGNAVLRRNKSIHSGSNYSTASLRKRFGLTHTSSARDPIRGEHHGDSPKGASVWRTLSKNSRREELQKGHISRSKSTDYDARTYHLPKRPTSQDRPTAFSTFTPLPPSPSSPMRPLSATSGPTHLAGGKPLPPGPPVRKKRRSSLSDLTTHRDYEQILPARVSPDLEKMTTPTKSGISGLKDVENYRTESPSPSQLPKPIGAGTPSRKMSKNRIEIPVRKKSLGMSGSTGPQKLKMQSTQKLRERLQNEKQAITMVDQSLQHEIDKIGEELSLATRVSSRGVKELTGRLEQVEARLPQINELNAKYEALKKSSDVALAKKDRELEVMDKDFNDCLNENDVMFEKFNEELVKISSGVKAGRDVELLKILQEVRAEQAKLKRDNMAAEERE